MDVSVKSEEPLHLLHVIFFRFVPCHFVLFRFVPCHFVLFRFVPCHFVFFRLVPCHFVLFRLFLFCLSVFSVERVSDEGGDSDAESHDAHLDEGHQNFNFIRHDVILRSWSDFAEKRDIFMRFEMSFLFSPAVFQPVDFLAFEKTNAVNAANAANATNAANAANANMRWAKNSAVEVRESHPGEANGVRSASRRFYISQRRRNCCRPFQPRE